MEAWSKVKKGLLKYFLASQAMHWISAIARAAAAKVSAFMDGPIFGVDVFL